MVGEKGLDFSPEIARSGRHKLMQYNRVGCLGLVYRESAKGIFPIDFSWGISRCMYSYLMSPTTKPAEAADTNFLHRWGGGDPTNLYNTTGYGLTGSFFEIQT